MGTPEFAVETLRRLVEEKYNIVAVVTQPDKPVGRHGSVLQPSEVKRYAVANGIPVLQPVKMKDEAFVSELASYKANLQIVVAFRMLPESVWSMPRFGTFNVHASLLPQYRGAAPINWAIINGETTTGVTTFFLDHNIDTGRIIMQREFDIPDDADAEYVYEGLMKLGAEVALATVDKVIQTDGDMETMSQEVSGDLKAAPKIFKETCRINWNDTSFNIRNFIRGLSPHPGGWTEMLTSDDSHAPNTLKVFKAELTEKPCAETPGSVMTERKRLYVATNDEWLELTVVQLSGKKRMSIGDFLNGTKDIARLK